VEAAMAPSPAQPSCAAFTAPPAPLLGRRHSVRLGSSVLRRPRTLTLPVPAVSVGNAGSGGGGSGGSSNSIRGSAAAAVAAASSGGVGGNDAEAERLEIAYDWSVNPGMEDYDADADDAAAVFETSASATAGQPGTATQYVPLHVHSDYSLLDGASQLPALVTRAAELGVPALALTDHGVLYGAVALVKHCKRVSPPVKPIIGNEMYVVNVDTPYVPPLQEEDEEVLVLEEGEVEEVGVGKAKGRKKKPPPPKKKKKKPAPRRYHLIVLAKNTVGYRNLVKLTTHAHLEGKVGPGMFARPCINKAMLYEHREGLIVSSGCLGGEIAQAILNDRPDVARSVACWFRDTFGDDYYLEIQDHGSLEDRKVNREVVAIGRELGIPVICTNDSHFTSCLDAEAHDALICIQTGKMLRERKRLRYAGNEFFKSVDEMRACFVDHLMAEDIEAALTRTLEVADKVQEYDLFGDTRIPDFPVPPCGAGGEKHSAYVNDDHVSYLRFVSREGMHIRLRNRLASGLLQAEGDESEVSAEYSARLEFELDMIEEMGFASYFLVVWDYIRYARTVGIPVGPGRGSAAGSLVAFALRITDVDPIQYNLLFERFLNPERKSMPDIDTDFSVDGREKIIRYVTEKYGTDRVAQIITFNRLTSKAVLKDVARVHEVPYAQADRLAKLIPVARGKPATLSMMLAKNGPSPEFRDILKKNPGWDRWIEKARRIEGTNKSFGIHAAGVVISAEPLSNLVPLSRAKHGETITQYPMEDVEALGLLKMDFLGLKNLTVIETTLGFINAKRRRLHELAADQAQALGNGREVSEGSCSVPSKLDLDFSVDALPLDDPATYDLLSNGELDGIFQLDASAGMRSIVRELRPSSLEDISAILALYRPGPLDAGLIPKFINRKHGREPISYDHVLLEPILKETYGVMVYQEQIMRIARDLAGYSLGQADILRRAMGKKKSEDMEREKPRFVKGAVARGVQEGVATKLFETMILFAEYCFNKSHSTAYAYLTYQTAYLKANYPVEYSAALLRANSNQADKLVRYLSDAHACGVRVLPPRINRSELGFTVDVVGKDQSKEESVVLFGLEAIKTVGDSVGRALIDERNANGPFRSIIDVIERLDPRVLNKRSMGALVMCGAFDELHQNRRVLHEQLEALLTLHRKMRDRRKRREKKVMTPEQEQVAIAKDAADWEEVQLILSLESDSSPDFPMLEKLAAEKATLGFYASGHPLLELGAEIPRVLGSTSVSAIVGETPAGADGELALSDSSLQHSGAGFRLADGAEVLCVSLVADLKRMVTARGQHMAKWSMEDTVGRVSAVVFPSAYTLCEERVGSRESDENNDGTAERELVVADDARVVVWGKVDRESSGTAQVIVDDVQRVEDVFAVVATIPYRQDELGLVRTDSKSQLIRYAVRQLRDPSSVYEVESSEYREFVNSQGVAVRARRRAKITDLSTKARIPVVIKELLAGDTPAVYSYAGHSCRLQTVCEADLEILREKTKCHFEILRVADVMGISSGGDKPESFLRAPAGTGAMHLPDASEILVKSVEFAGQSANEPVLPLSDCAVIEVAARSTSTLELDGTESAGGCEKGQDIFDDRERAKDEETEWKVEPEWSQHATTVVDVSERQFDSASREDWNQRRTTLRERTRAPESSDLMQRLRARRIAISQRASSSPAQVAVMERDNSDTQSSMRFLIPLSSSDLHVSSNAEAICVEASPRKPREIAEITSASVVADDGPPSGEPSGESARRTIPKLRYGGEEREDRESELRPLSRILDDQYAVKSDEDPYNKLAVQQLAYTFDKEQARLFSRCGFSFDGPEGYLCWEAAGEDAGEKRVRLFRRGNGDAVWCEPVLPPSLAGVDTLPQDGVAVETQYAGDRPLVPSEKRLNNSEHGLDLNATTDKEKSKRRRKHIGLDLSEIGFGGLLDAAALVASDVASSHVNARCVLTSLDKLDLSALLPPLSGQVDVIGTVAAVDVTAKEGAMVRVLLRIRESVPTGGRKRTRMLASSVLSFSPQSADLALRPLPQTSIQARKDMALVRKRIDELNQCDIHATVEESVGGTLSLPVPLALRQCIPTDAISDGGNVMLWMASAADHLARQKADDVEASFLSSCVSSFHMLEGFHPDHDRFMWCLARVVRVSFDLLTVVVELKVSDADEVEAARTVASAIFQVKAANVQH
jgi:DNA polymerase III subunit alpha